MVKKIVIVLIVVLALIGVGIGGFLLRQRFLSQNQVALEATPIPKVEPVRSNVSCEVFKTRGYKTEFVDNSWGPSIPDSFKVLPPGAQLCGYIPSLHATFLIQEGLDDLTLFNYYRNFMTGSNCTYFGTQESGGDKSPFRRALLINCDQKRGYVFTYNEQNAYMIQFVSFGSTQP